MTPEFFPRERYYCVLDEQPDLLVPSAAETTASLNHAGSLIVNPRCWLGWHGSLPSALAAAATWHASLFDFEWTIWVDDPDRGTLWPYWLGPRYAELLQDIEPGQPYEGDLPSDVADRLLAAGILTAPGSAEWRRRAWANMVSEMAPLFERGFLQLSGLLPQYQIGALRRYYRYHTRMGTFALGDEQTPGRFVAYDEPTTKYVHQQLARTISDLARRVVVPSYNYLAFYQGGAVLDPHTDREACEYTVSLCIDATPDPHTYGAWPLGLITPDGPVSVVQDIGEALLFRGRSMSHWRDRLPEGYTSSSVLFHFVDA